MILVQLEEDYLNWMVDCNHEDDQLIAEFAKKARLAVINHDMFKEDIILDIAEKYVLAVKLIKANKFTIKDIRKQREKIQWLKKKTTKPPIEPSQS